MVLSWFVECLRSWEGGFLGLGLVCLLGGVVAFRFLRCWRVDIIYTFGWVLWVLKGFLRAQGCGRLCFWVGIPFVWGWLLSGCWGVGELI